MYNVQRHGLLSKKLPQERPYQVLILELLWRKAVPDQFAEMGHSTINPEYMIETTSYPRMLADVHLMLHRCIVASKRYPKVCTSLDKCAIL